MDDDTFVIARFAEGTTGDPKWDLVRLGDIALLHKAGFNFRDTKPFVEIWDGRAFVEWVASMRKPVEGLQMKIVTCGAGTHTIHPGLGLTDKHGTHRVGPALDSTQFVDVSNHWTALFQTKLPLQLSPFEITGTRLAGFLYALSGPGFGNTSEMTYENDDLARTCTIHLKLPASGHMPTSSKILLEWASGESYDPTMPFEFDAVIPYSSGETASDDTNQIVARHLLAWAIRFLYASALRITFPTFLCQLNDSKPAREFLIGMYDAPGAPIQTLAQNHFVFDGPHQQQRIAEIELLLRYLGYQTYLKRESGVTIIQSKLPEDKWLSRRKRAASKCRGVPVTKKTSGNTIVYTASGTLACFPGGVRVGATDTDKSEKSAN